MKNPGSKRAWQILALVVVIAVLAEKGVMWWNYSHRSRSNRNPVAPVSVNAPIEVRMHQIAMVAIATIEPNARRPFDFSPGSLVKVDEILDQLPQMVSATNRDEELSYACLAWGAYVGEVIRHQHPTGTWSEATDEKGYGIYPLQIGPLIVYPCQWVVERVEKGPTASVSKRYEEFVQQRQ